MRFGELSAVEAWIIKVYRESMGTDFNKYLVQGVSIVERMMNEAKQSSDCEVIDFQSVQGSREHREV